MYQLQIGSGLLKTPWVQFGSVKNRTEIHQDPSWVPLGAAQLLKPQEAKEVAQGVEGAPGFCRALRGAEPSPQSFFQPRCCHLSPDLDQIWTHLWILLKCPSAIVIVQPPHPCPTTVTFPWHEIRCAHWMATVAHQKFL